MSLVDCPPCRPVWAITKHADITEIERADDLFLSEPRPLPAPAEADDFARAQLDAGMGLRTPIHMDDPRHRVVRAIGADWFRPKAMRALKIRVDELAKIYVDTASYYVIIATAGHDTTSATIAEGESVYLSYVSANRDEEVFEDPFRFDVGRDPNKHLAFGWIPSRAPVTRNSSRPRSWAASSTCRFDIRSGSPIGLNV